jgi:hypothetical protein
MRVHALALVRFAGVHVPVWLHVCVVCVRVVVVVCACVHTRLCVCVLRV